MKQKPVFLYIVSSGKGQSFFSMRLIHMKKFTLEELQEMVQKAIEVYKTLHTDMCNVSIASYLVGKFGFNLDDESGATCIHMEETWLLTKTHPESVRVQIQDGYVLATNRKIGDASNVHSDANPGDASKV